MCWVVWGLIKLKLSLKFPVALKPALNDQNQILFFSKMHIRELRILPPCHISSFPVDVEGSFFFQKGYQIASSNTPLICVRCPAELQLGAAVVSPVSPLVLAQGTAAPWPREHRPLFKTGSAHCSPMHAADGNSEVLPEASRRRMRGDLSRTLFCTQSCLTGHRRRQVSVTDSFLLAYQNEPDSV